MAGTILVVNAGSSSIKFALFDSATAGGLAPGAKVQVEGIGTAPRLTVNGADGAVRIDRACPAAATHRGALDEIRRWLSEHLVDGAVQAVGHRIVHGGQTFAAPVRIDATVMGTRCGAIDPGVLLNLMDQERMDARALERLLYYEAGLLGVSGISSDMRTLLASTDERARAAVDLFVYHIGRELGSLAAALGGLDALVFTGGIGENAAAIRARVCHDAAWLGIAFDAAANDAGGPCISPALASPSAWVVRTDENLMIVRHVRRLLTPTTP